MTIKQAYDHGYDAGLNGANTTNSHFSIFATKELMEAWSAGNAKGKEAKDMMEEKG